MPNVTLTLKLPDTLVADAMAEAVERKVSLDALVIEALEDLLDSPDEDEDDD